MFYFAGPLWAARLRGKVKGWDLVEGLVAGAQPSGTTTRACYEALRAELLADLKKALPVDMVVLGLHGAMVAEGYDDCEGDILQKVREIVGPGVVVGAELDPHCHLTTEMVENADLLIAYKEYPHTDVLERGLELVDLCEKIVEKRVRPVAALVDCEMIVTVHTSREPARSFVDRLQAMEGRDGIVSISLAHGFAWGDVPGMGTKVLVYADGDAAARAHGGAPRRRRADRPAREAPARRTRHRRRARRGARRSRGQGPGRHLRRRRQPRRRRRERRHLLPAPDRRARHRDVAIGPFWDPIAARIAIEAGEGARLPLRIGGKVSPLSGDPIDLDCTVKAVRLEHVQTGLSNTRAEMGDSALVEANGVEILLCSLRNQAMGTDLFTGIGCDLAAKRIVVVKSSQHFHASYSKVASHVIYAAAPGAVTLDVRTLPYKKVRRPKWPLDA
jgi:microcystin degradation protein MlrC